MKRLCLCDLSKLVLVCGGVDINQGRNKGAGRKLNFGRELISRSSVCPSKPVENKIIGRESVTQNCRELNQPRVSTVERLITEKRNTNITITAKKLSCFQFITPRNSGNCKHQSLAYNI